MLYRKKERVGLLHVLIITKSLHFRDFYHRAYAWQGLMDALRNYTEHEESPLEEQILE